MKVTEIAPGQKFTILGVEYIMVRQTGEVIDVSNRNQWGRAEGGTHKAHKVVVKINKRRYGWSYPKYMAIEEFYHCKIID